VVSAPNRPEDATRRTAAESEAGGKSTQIVVEDTNVVREPDELAAAPEAYLDRTITVRGRAVVCPDLCDPAA
jgi:hypothetical protein